MQEPEPNSIKAWAPEYNESPFYFEQDFKKTTRLVAWSDSPKQSKAAFFALATDFPERIEVLLKIHAPDDSGSKKNGLDTMVNSVKAT